MTTEILHADDDAPAWRAPVPGARAAMMALYGWRDPTWAFLAAMMAATPFICASAFAPAMLSLAPTVEPVGQVADARALAAGGGSLTEQSAPFHLMLLMLADRFVDAPGRIQLAAKAVAAVLAAYPLAYFVSVRLPTWAAASLTAAVAAFIAAPFSDVSDLALAFFLVSSTALALAPADDGWDRAVFEGLLVGALMFALWLLNPVFTLAGLVVLSACPFLTGLAGLSRYATAFATLVAFAAVAEFVSPGLNAARAEIASAIVSEGLMRTVRTAGAWGVAGVAASSIVAIVAAAVFGGRDHIRGWGAGAGFFVIAGVAAAASGAQPALAFALAAAIATFSIHSPFYDGVFRDHDRGSVAVAGAAGSLVMFWIALGMFASAADLAVQWRAGRAASSAAAEALGIIHPTPKARAAYALLHGEPQWVDGSAHAPVDQSDIIFEAAARAQSPGLIAAPIAFLTGDDTACVFSASRPCRSDARTAAAESSVVFVPRVSLSTVAGAQKERAEAFLYTEFRLAERTEFWELWVRRGVTLPDGAVFAGRGL